MAERTSTEVPDQVRAVPPPAEREPSAAGGREPGRAAPAARPAAQPPEPYGNGGPADPESMRREIERTRARLSGTLDEIEDRLVAGKRDLLRKKDDLWAKATLRDLRHGVTREPWRSVALAFVAGYIVAALRD